MDCSAIGSSWGGNMGLWERCKKALGERWENFLDFYMATARADPRIKAEWREVCGVSKDEDIDYDNPVVRLTYDLCDIRNLKMIYKGRHREEFLSQYPPEYRDYYFKRWEDGSSISDWEKPHVFKAMMHNVRKTITKFYKKLRKEGKISKKDLEKAEAEARKIDRSSYDEDILTDEDLED